LTFPEKVCLLLLLSSCGFCSCNKLSV
jgi:hypothetical protein